MCGDLLTLFTDPMSLFDDGFSLNGSKRTSGSLANVAEFVNPQYTQLGFLTPEPSPTDATPRYGSFALSENRTTYFSGSSESSFRSHSGCGTPYQSTPDSSASNSRRPSILLPESQQCYLSAISSSPSSRSQRPKRAVGTDQSALQESSPGSYIASTDTASFISDSAAACTPGGELTMVTDGYTEKAPRLWQNYGPPQDTSSIFERAAQPGRIDELTSWNPDLVADFDSSIVIPASHAFELSQPLFSHTQPATFDCTASQPEVAGDPADNTSSSVPSLAPAFEFCLAKYDTEVEFVDDDRTPDATVGPSIFDNILIRQPLDDSSHKNRNKRQRQSEKRREGVTWKIVPRKDKIHNCRRCDYACNRWEHLRRHEDSKHLDEKTNWLPCVFDGCKDRKADKHREIKARNDNLVAHYNKTHFKYGSTEKGGKNERKSMKEAHEMGLCASDQRWTLLLEEKMNVNHEIEGFLHVWKMLGYSIRETRDTRVKEVVPDWPCPEDETLQKYDARWKALWDGTLTFDQAMSVGKDMKESEKQGLLGVTMLETEEMGIKHLDVRWVEMDNRRMSVEQSEKLGVKQRNPVWKDLVTRRKARGWVEKF